MQNRLQWIVLSLGATIAIQPAAIAVSVDGIAQALPLAAPSASQPEARSTELKQKEAPLATRIADSAIAQANPSEDPPADLEETDGENPDAIEADDAEAVPVLPSDPQTEVAPQPTENESFEDPALPSSDDADDVEALPSAAELDDDDVPPPDYLNDDPNPLRYPTQTEEVEIIGAQPITLEQAFEIAARNNRDLQVAQLELEQSRAALQEQRAANYPTVNFNGNLTGTENTSQGASTNNEFFEQLGESLGIPFEAGDQGDQNQDDINFNLSGTVSLNYDLYTSGRRSALIRAAEEQVRLNELDVERIEEEIRLNVANAYYDVQQAEEQIRINAAFLEEALRSRRDAVIREQAGVGTRFDVLQAEVQVANAQQDLTQARSDREIASRALAQILSIPPSLDLAVTPVEAEDPWPLTLEESIILAFQNRAELEQQLVQREISEQQRRAALAQLGPQVSLSASYDVTNNLNSDQGFQDQYSFGAGLRWLLFDAGAARAQAEQQERGIEIAETQFADALDTVRLDVERAFYNQQANRANIDTARIAVDQAREALRLARLRFQAGVGTQLDVISQQAALTQAEGNLVQAIVGFNRAVAELQRAISNLPEGRLLDSLEIPPASEFVNPLSLEDQEAGAARRTTNR